MNITVNDESVTLQPGCTVAGMLAYLHLDAAKVAVERNLEIIPVTAFDSQGLCEGDRIEIVHFIGGG